MNNILRTQMQQQAIQAVLDDRRVIVEWATGVGKSRIAVGAVSRLLAMGRHRILLLVTETIHKANWRREFTEALGEQTGEDVFSCLTVECYASLSKYRDTEWDFVIADEAHHLRSELRTDGFCSITAERVLALSATLSDNHDADELLKCMNDSFGQFRFFRFSLQDAIDSSILPEPKIFVHVLRLSDFTEPVTVNVEWGSSPKYRRHARTDAAGFVLMWRNPQQYPNMELEVTCPPKQAYAVLDTVYNSCKMAYDRAKARFDAMPADDPTRSGKEFQLTLLKNRMLQYALRRKNLLGSLKTGYARRLLRDTVAGRKFICFCASVDQALELNAPTVIHSKRTAGENARIISDFCEGRSRSLFAIGMAQEGANLPGIQVGVVIQLDMKERKFVQEFGRAMRSSDPEQHIIVFNNTRDVDFVRSALKNISGKYVRHIDGRTGLPMTPIKPAAPRLGLSNTGGGVRQHA